jgi:dTDP-4-amino-4,6-dideoxygalactose transaminase
MCGEEQKFIKEAFDLNWIAPLGPHLKGFEEDLCSYTGAKYAAAFNSGTAAIHLALILLGITKRDEVISSSFTFAATSNPIIYQGAAPILVDSEYDTWNMDPALLETAIEDRISKGNKPKVIMVVHLYGMPAKMDEIMAVANKYSIPVIEDAAEALGSKYKGKPLGTFGEIGILSFNGNKIITTSGGGALLSENEGYIKQAKFLSEQARDPAPHYQHTKLGYNYRLSNVCAAIGRGQMTVLDERVKRRREIFNIYKDALGDIEAIKFPGEPEGFFSNRWLTCILVDPGKRGVSREDIRKKFEQENIDSRPLWKPMHLQPVYEGYPAYINGTSEYLFDHGLCLPSGTNMPDSDIERIIKVIRSFYDE